MRLLANENIPLGIVEALRLQGHDVSWTRMSAPGSSDRDVFLLPLLETAVSEDRIVVTFDKDFGDLVLRGTGPTPPGVILFRFSVPSPRRVAQMAAAALAGRTDWLGHFSVVEETRVRIVPMPRTGR